MGITENNNLNIIISHDKSYNLDNTDEAINFLIYALNGNYSSFFIDFVFSHIGLDVFKYSKSFVDEQKNKSIFEIHNDVKPFFDFFFENYYEDNVFYKYIYESKESDFIKKQKINKIIEGLKKTLNFYFDFHSVIIFRNCEIDKDYDFIRKCSITLELCVNYTYYSICKILINFYDYIYDEFYAFIESKNEFNYNYSNKIKEYLKNKSKEEIKRDAGSNQIENNIWINVFKCENDFENFKFFLENKIIDDYADLSYLFQKLLKEKKIHTMKHLDFAKWIFEKKLIKEKAFNEIESQNGFRSLTKSFSKHRESNYFEIFKK